MSKFITKIGYGIDVKPLLWALRSNPQLWNEHSGRTKAATSPHREVDDIWVRYAAPDVSQDSGPHESVWYPSAALLDVGDICGKLMSHVGGERLGGVLITQIPPGKQVHPHQDHGWHARYYEKFAVQIESAPGQRFCFDDGSLETQPGDVYWFENSVRHWVENPTPYNRITMIVCIKPTHIP